MVPYITPKRRSKKIVFCCGVNRVNTSWMKTHKPYISAKVFRATTKYTIMLNRRCIATVLAKEFGCLSTRKYHSVQMVTYMNNVRDICKAVIAMMLSYYNMFVIYFIHLDISIFLLNKLDHLIKKLSPHIIL